MLHLDALLAEGISDDEAGSGGGIGGVEFGLELEARLGIAGFVAVAVSVFAGLMEVGCGGIFDFRFAIFD